MNKEAVIEKIKEMGLLAVLRGPSPELTVQMVDALAAGGVTGIEITYSTPNAAEVVRELDRKYGDRLLLGMGTLTVVNQIQEAQSAGARFIVSPMCEAGLLQAMVSSGLACMPGAFTPTEVFRAYQMGADVIKIFPGSLAGPAYIKALKGPFPYIPMMPTGGVSSANVADWFAAGVVAVGAGSELCPPALAMQGKWDEITRLARVFVENIQAARSK
jgi:2-dehydro-3-deoxyphosphogluconate aldolase/(4S)-4-hydroxy-2-oxoglutarate aldolase